MDSPPAQPFVPELYDPQRPLTMRRVFMGPFGLRAGWSLLIYFAILASIVASAYIVLHHIRATHPHTVMTAGTPASAVKSLTNAPMLTRVLLEDMTFPVFFLLSWLMAVIERRKLTVFGLGGTHPFRRFLVGAVWGFLAMSLLIFVLHSLRLLSFDTQLLHGRAIPGWAIPGWAIAQLLAFLFVGLVEEYVYRGYLQFTLTRCLMGLGSFISRPHARAIAFWLASSVTSALFLLSHTSNGGENKPGLLQVFVVGFVFLAALWRTGSLWWAIGFHMTWDWAQSFLYGVPDSGGLMQGRLFVTHAWGNPLWSGGSAGPEGSVFCIPVLFLVIVVLCFTNSSPQPPLEAKS